MAMVSFVGIFQEKNKNNLLLLFKFKGGLSIQDFNWSPLSEEGYAEKLRLLREASASPMERWRASQVLAWLEVALTPLVQGNKPFHKRIIPRLSFKGNLVAEVFSLVGQHYYLTLRHSVKRGAIESSVRAYVEKNLKQWNEQQHKIRAKIFKPIQPKLERWSKSLAKKYAAEKKKG